MTDGAGTTDEREGTRFEFSALPKRTGITSSLKERLISAI